MSEVLNRPTATTAPGVAPDGAPAARPERQDILAFVTDAGTETILRDALADAASGSLDVRRADIRGAIAVLRKTASPRTLIVDISGEEQPLTALDDLSHVVEPDIRVLLLGDREDANFYRQVTKGLGVLEYIHKPVQRDMIARYFGPLLAQTRQTAHTVHGGRVVSITGVRGGVGASTLAANLAWHFGVEANRHTVVVDSDLHRGTCAMLLGARTGSGLRTAIETPARIDELFVERAAQPAMARLHVLASEEKLAEQPNYISGATTKLLDALRRRYNFVVVDLPFTGQQMHRDLADARASPRAGDGPHPRFRARHAAPARAAQRADAAAQARHRAEPARPPRHAEPQAGRGSAEDAGRRRDRRPAEDRGRGRDPRRARRGQAQRLPHRPARARPRGRRAAQQ